MHGETRTCIEPDQDSPRDQRKASERLTDPRAHPSGSLKYRIGKNFLGRETSKNACRHTWDKASK